MAALGRTYSRLISCRHRYASFSFGRNVKCLFQAMTVQHSSLTVSSPRDNDADHGILLSQKVLTRKDFVPTLFIGKEGKNIKRLKELCGREFKVTMKDRHILVSGSDAEGVKRSVEKVTQEVQRIEMLPKVKVLTDEDAGVHRMIFGIVSGERGKNIERLKSETHIDFDVINEEVGCLVVRAGSDDFEDVKIAEEIIKQEVQRAKNQVVPQFTGNVLTDEDADVHRQICRRIIGKGGQIIKYLLSKLEPNINVTFKAGQIFVSGSDAEEVQRAVEILKHEVQNIKDGVVPLPFKGKVLTDEDADFHRNICGRIIGKGGKKIEQLTSELGSYIEMESQKIGHIVVGGIDAKVVKAAVEILKHEVLRAKSQVFPQFTEKVLTNEEADVHSQICRMIIGKGGKNMKKLTSELGPYVNVDLKQLGHIVVSGNDAEEVERAIQKLTQEVQRAINIIAYPFKGKVLTDEDTNFHYEICAKIIGKEGKNIDQLTSELGSSIRVNSLTAGHIVVAGTNTGVVERAVERLKQEVQNIKDEDDALPFTGKVSTNEDADFHSQICRRVIGKGGENIKRLTSELGPYVNVDLKQLGHIVVSGNDSEEVERAIQKLKQEVQRAINIIAYPFKGKVLTDEDANFHYEICAKIVGKEGKSIDQLKSELGSSIRLDTITAGHIVVAGTNAGVVERAVELLKQEVQNFKDADNALPFTGKVSTNEDADLHRDICGRIIGKGGENIKRLTSELGPNIRLQIQKFGHILVSGIDAEEVERAVEILKQEVQRGYNNFIRPFTEKVFTIEDAQKHSRICRMITGKGGRRIKNLKAKLGSDIDITHIKSYIVVSGTNAEMVEKAAEKIKREVQIVKNMVVQSYTEKVTTDEDGDIHARICGRLIGKGGYNLQLMKLNSGLNFYIDIQENSKTPCVYVYASSMEVLEKAVEVVKHQIETVRKKIILDSCKSLYEDWHMKTENS